MSWVEVDGQMLWQCPTWAGRIRWATFEGDLLLVETEHGLFEITEDGDAVGVMLDAPEVPFRTPIRPPMKVR